MSQIEIIEALKVLNEIIKNNETGISVNQEITKIAQDKMIELIKLL